MRILIVSSTYGEISPLIDFLNLRMQRKEKFCTCKFLEDEISISIVGIGSYSMLYWLTKYLHTNKYDLVLNVGIAGSFVKDVPVGDVVFVSTEEIGDIGVNDNGVFKDLFEEGFVDKNEFPFTEGRLDNPYIKEFNFSGERLVRSLSVNTVSGYDEYILFLKDKYKAEIESMEGAAFHYVCLWEGVKFMQIRGISNVVQGRKKDDWEFGLAVKNLNETVRFFLLNILKMR